MLDTPIEGGLTRLYIPDITYKFHFNHTESRDANCSAYGCTYEL